MTVSPSRTLLRAPGEIVSLRIATSGPENVIQPRAFPGPVESVILDVIQHHRIELVRSVHVRDEELPPVFEMALEKARSEGAIDTLVIRDTREELAP